VEVTKQTSKAMKSVGHMNHGDSQNLVENIGETANADEMLSEKKMVDVKVAIANA